MIRNGPKRIIFVSSGFKLLEMVLEPDTERCASKDTGPPRGVDCEIPHQLERGNETLLIRVWKPLPIRRVLKS